MAEEKRQIQQVNERGIVLRDSGDVFRVAQGIAGSALCPKQYRGKPKDAMIAILAGLPLGFSPMQALCAIAVINGTPALWGDGRAAVVLDSGKCEWVKEWYELDGKGVDPSGQYAKLDDFPNGLTACWQGKRRDMTEPTRVVRFAVGDAKLAGIWGRNVWAPYPMRMLQMRARAFGERDYFADALAGLGQVEELSDLPESDRDELEGDDQFEAEAIDVEDHQPEQSEPEEAAVAVEESEPLEPPAEEPEAEKPKAEAPPATTPLGEAKKALQRAVMDAAQTDATGANTLIVAKAKEMFQAKTLSTVAQVEAVQAALVNEPEPEPEPEEEA